MLFSSFCFYRANSSCFFLSTTLFNFQLLVLLVSFISFPCFRFPEGMQSKFVKVAKEVPNEKKVNEFQINEKLNSGVEQKRNAFSCIFIANSQVSLIQRKKCMSLLAAPFYGILFSSNSIFILLFNSLNYLKIILSHGLNLWFSYSMYDNKNKKKKDNEKMWFD